jgi:methionyl-tRNA formyltransferase
MKIIFMGTPEFAVPSLQILVENGYEVVAVVTATDKLGGRGNKLLIQSAVKQYALSQGLRVLQPEKLRDEVFLETLKSLEADLQVVVAFRMLPEMVWAMPRLGTINLHGSLLPKYRGAAPINWAIINGERETGVTTFFLQQQIDTGDVLQRVAMPIGDDETASQVHDRMMHLGAQTVLSSVQQIEKGNYTLQAQTNEAATHAPKIFSETCEINFSQPCASVHNFVRGLAETPTAWTMLQGTKLKIFRTQKIERALESNAGDYVTDGKTYLHFACADAYIAVLDLQLEGKKRMEVRSFLNGYKF